MKKRPLAFLLVIIIICAAAATYLITRNLSAQTRAWQLSTQMSCAGTQDTTEFNMSNQWRIIWNIQKRTGPLFIIAVYSKTDSGYPLFYEDDESDTTATDGTLLMNSTGTFLVRMVALSDTEWNLRIEEYAPVKPT
jgi:hypothetical protein